MAYPMHKNTAASYEPLSSLREDQGGTGLENTRVQSQLSPRGHPQGLGWIQQLYPKLRHPAAAATYQEALGPSEHSDGR